MKRQDDTDPGETPRCLPFGRETERSAREATALEGWGDSGLVSETQTPSGEAVGASRRQAQRDREGEERDMEKVEDFETDCTFSWSASSDSTGADGSRVRSRAFQSPRQSSVDGCIHFHSLEDPPVEEGESVDASRSKRRAASSRASTSSASSYSPSLDSCLFSQFSALHRSLLIPLLKGGGIVTPTDVQERCIPLLLAGNSSLVVAPTGSGKTLAWALPLLHRWILADTERLAPYPQQPGLVVLVPSRELASQVLGQLRRFSSVITSAACAAGQSYVKEVRMLRSGVDVVVSTPARLLLHLHKKNVNMNRVMALVIEEADTLCDSFFEQELCVLLSSHFRRFQASPSLALATPGSARGVLPESGTDQARAGWSSSPHQRQNLLEMQESQAPARREADENADASAGELPHRNDLQLVFVAATKTGALARFLKQQIGRVHITSVCTPDAHLAAAGVQQVFVSLNGQDRMSRLMEVLEERVGGGDGKTMIFCNTVNTCRAVDLTLLEKGYKVSCLHGLMPFKLRKASFQKLQNGETNILVCTNVASRGLDVEGVKHVIHFDFPQTLADYLHRSGRTARGGETGRVTILFSKRNLPLIQQIQNASRAATSPPELRHATPRIRRVLRLEERWKELIDMRNPKRKIGGRKKLGLPPNRNTVGPKAKWAIKKLYFRLKAKDHLQFLRSRGILGKKELLPRHPRVSVERSDAQQAMKMIRGDDGLLQVLPVRRSKFFMVKQAQKSQSHQSRLARRPAPFKRFQVSKVDLVYPRCSADDDLYI
ncbi:putative ATP-dependent RNA helicase [Neospora caninum Liverpool]|uniref:Putative ATP-dependent RNA helicase n=1 Tax=Neospora caninum (strain Liverpool) TaxID=572307 RepID=F0VM99_NEOCL|nr:putative ATP-dependent RNA helicase [Neospora caninum Liverpool]CBZ54377.1 putative ATP-dependent RNA helicase [Neospora caninum Liverpool]|eukprot:XP_003884407.1 putative ATP-dependent RNA helicase [Neospora caninum Liverpool]